MAENGALQNNDFRRLFQAILNRAPPDVVAAMNEELAIFHNNPTLLQELHPALLLDCNTGNPATAVLMQAASDEADAQITMADAKIRALIEDLRAEGFDDFIIELQRALVFINSPTAHPATGAANAERLLSSILQFFRDKHGNTEMQAKIKGCLQTVRDIIAKKCQSMYGNIQDRTEFLKVLAMAYGVQELEKQVRIMSGMSPYSNFCPNC